MEVLGKYILKMYTTPQHPGEFWEGWVKVWEDKKSVCLLGKLLCLTGYKDILMLVSKKISKRK